MTMPVPGMVLTIRFRTIVFLVCIHAMPLLQRQTEAATLTEGGRFHVAIAGHGRCCAAFAAAIDRFCHAGDGGVGWLAGKRHAGAGAGGGAASARAGPDRRAAAGGFAASAAGRGAGSACGGGCSLCAAGGAGAATRASLMHDAGRCMSAPLASGGNEKLTPG
ncbi:Hypothetical protein GbCGDNIH1_0262a [Granulibacter bethesdensis CGDNIH1]|uniref:Uncharacterized protein n=1 Tax=Granulibacter bethesdensis (strain ATCC BAA-1260 / CGDNIH1) TaxID=391165 RepID=A0A286M2U8_GRABC|nr:Hypothetical protein GbCGDNIH1I4_0262 [Granulibacter bethesdensis]ASV62347.1 Hypothetical protein GbCGDNIH1_0262a [Granulibacter bethesdensis CGDNIH1]